MFHKKCGQNVYVMVNKLFKLLVNPVPGKNVLLARRGFVEVVKDVVEISSGDFYCPTCSQEITTSEIIIRCMDCGIETSMLSAYKNMDSGLIVCKEHANSEAKKLELMVRKISIKNI